MFPVTNYPSIHSYSNNSPEEYYNTGDGGQFPYYGNPNYFPDFFTPPREAGAEEVTTEEINGNGGGNIPGATPPIPLGAGQGPQRVVNTSGGFQEQSMTGTGFQSAVIPELYGFSGATGNPELAKKLISFVEAMYASDPDFKEAIDSLIDKYGYVSITSNDLEGNTAGLATIGGNEVIIDDEFIANNDLEGAKKVIAHEFGHNLGYDHGAELDAFVEGATDEVDSENIPTIVDNGDGDDDDDGNGENNGERRGGRGGRGGGGCG